MVRYTLNFTVHSISCGRLCEAGGAVFYFLDKLLFEKYISKIMYLIFYQMDAECNEDVIIFESWLCINSADNTVDM